MGVPQENSIRICKIVSTKLSVYVWLQIPNHKKNTWKKSERKNKKEYLEEK
jgi:hypothetical protein